jgi:signal transduction histidine kinase
VFLPFQRLGDRDNHTGVGLGLALSRGLTEAMGGTLVPTTPGGGLTMILTRDGADVRLSPTEWRLLEYLLRHPGKLLNRRSLLHDVCSGLRRPVPGRGRQRCRRTRSVTATSS